MCGRFAIAYTIGLLARFGVKQDIEGLAPRFNVAPTQMAPIVISESPNKALMMRWGLIPFWAKDPKIGNRLINARSENLKKSPAYRASFKNRRCIVPVTGFYEWKKQNGAKAPYYVRMKDDSPFGLAGLYDRWNDPEGREVMSFTIVTTVPNRLLAPIHNRMPVILRQEHEDLWLRHGPLTDKEADSIFRPHPARPMETYEVSTQVNNPRNDSEGIIRPA